MSDPIQRPTDSALDHPDQLRRAADRQRQLDLEVWATETPIPARLSSPEEFARRVSAQVGTATAEQALTARVTRFSFTAFASRPNTREELRGRLRKGLPALLTRLGCSDNHIGRHVDCLGAFVTDEATGRIPLAEGRRFTDAFPGWVAEYAVGLGLPWRAVTAEDMARMAEAVAVAEAVRQFDEQVQREKESAWPWVREAVRSLAAAPPTTVAALRPPRPSGGNERRVADLHRQVAQTAERLLPELHAYFELTAA